MIVKNRLLLQADAGIHSGDVARIAKKRIEVHLSNLGSSLDKSTYTCNLVSIEVEVNSLLSTNTLQNLVSTKFGESLFCLGGTDGSQCTLNIL